MIDYIKQKMNTVPGRVGVYYEDLEIGESFEVLRGTEEDVFQSASVIKLWIMSAAYELAEKGLLDLNSRVAIREEDKVPLPDTPDYYSDMLRGLLTEDMFPESGILNYMDAGQELTVKDLIKLMILISDNTAANVLIDLLEQDVINAHIKSLGCEKTYLHRKLFDTRPEVRGKENLISLRETADFFRKMFRGELVSPSASREMCAILQNQQNTYKIPFYMRHTPIAHKTGEDSGIENDVAIVFTDRPFIMCFASNEADEPESIRLCQDLARDLLEYNRRDI
ncbi:MAG: serine hydrolase [Firmicutes bacterium]|nr:serine hydrolase [Bacillota bacterium]